MSKIQIFGVFFLSVTSVLISVNQAKHKFYNAEITAILSSLVALALLYFLIPEYGIKAAAWLFVLRTAIQTALLLPVLGSWTPFSINDPAFTLALTRIKPLLTGSIIYKTGPLFDNFLASFVPAGGLSIFNFIQRLIGAATQLASKAIASPALTHLSVLATTQRNVEFIHLYRNRLKVSAIIIMLIYIVVLLLVFVFEDFYRRRPVLLRYTF